MNTKRVIPVLLAICFTLALFPSLELVTSSRALAASAPVGYWKFDEGSGTTAADASGNGHTGTLQSGASWAAGVVGSSSLSLNGSSTSYVDIPASVVDTSQSYSVATWVKLNNNSGVHTALSMDGNQMSAFYLQLAGGNFCFCVFGSDAAGATLYRAVTSTTPSTGQWYHLAGVYDASAKTIALYLNGVLQQTTSYPSAWKASGHTIIGRGKYTGNPVDFWPGQIDDTRIYNAVLSANDIQALANGGNSGGGGQNEPACAAGLPANTGTNYPTPSDPNGFGVANQSIIGWEGNTYAPFAYLSGAFFARGVTASTYTAGGTSYCGAMYSFGVYTYGLNGARPATGSVQWAMDSGYLPALTTSFSRNNIAISIKNFADQVTINGKPFELVYSRVALTNNSSAAVTIDPQPSSGLAALNSVSNTIQPGQTANHDYVVAVDSFGANLLLPSGSTLTSAAPTLDTAYSQMSLYWNNRLASIPTLSLPNLTLPNTNSLSNPGTALNNAYRAAFVYTRIIQVGTSPFSGANNYDAVFNHDAPGILVNRFTLGDFQDAHNLLLNARPSESNPYYYDGVLKTPWAWAVYLYETGDTSFVSQYFHDDASGSSPNGPSLYTMMHTIPGHLNSAGYIGVTGDNDSSGTWLFDDYSALLGLASYKYIATKIGNAAEATWADQQFTTLMNNTNKGLAANQQANNFSYLSCEVNVPDSADRCNAPSDSNWAANTFFGQNAWGIMLMGGNPGGLIANPTQIDNTYDFGYGRLKGVLPYPTAGAFTGYSTAYNTTYGEGAFLGTKYRDLALTSYAWQLATTTSGPNAWWEAESSLTSNNPWAGSHANPEFGAIPYAWPLAGQTLALINAIAAPGFTTTTGGSSFSYTPALYIGRGIPDTWIANGQTISIGNYHTGNGQSNSTFGVSISTSLNSSSHRVVAVTLSGTAPTGTISIGIPAFNSAGVSQVQGGTYDASAHTVTVTPGTTSISVTLNS